MKLLILVLLHLFLTVQSDSEIFDDQQHEDTSLYETILSSFYSGDNQGSNWNAPVKPKNQRGNSNANKNNNQGKINRKSKNYHADEKDIKIDYKIYEPEVPGYVGGEPIYNKGGYRYKLMGREGLGFDLRTATSNGLTAPLTAKLLEVVRQHNMKKKNEDIVYPLII